MAIHDGLYFMLRPGSAQLAKSTIVTFNFAFTGGPDCRAVPVFTDDRLASRLIDEIGESLKEALVAKVGRRDFLNVLQILKGDGVTHVHFNATNLKTNESATEPTPIEDVLDEYELRPE